MQISRREVRWPNKALQPTSIPSLRGAMASAEIVRSASKKDCMNICDATKSLSLEVKKFLENVKDVKEESITDYLVWKWKELDKRFNYISTRTFNHDEESSISGADFDLELWLVGRTHHVSLAVQAKKFIKPHDSYIRKLNYPDGTKQQMITLLAYAAANKKLPVYFIYSVPAAQTTTMCGRVNTIDGGVFMADAKVMEEFADAKRGKRASRDSILDASIPFHCMFCCPLSQNGRDPTSYFISYFSQGTVANAETSNDGLPGYVKDLLRGPDDVPVLDMERGKLLRDGWAAFNTVAVYDLRVDA